MDPSGFGSALSSCNDSNETDGNDEEARDVFLRAAIADGEVSTSRSSEAGSSISGKQSTSNTSSYCRVGEDSSINAIFFAAEKIPPEGEVSEKSSKSHECPFCHRQFFNKFIYKVHLRCHTGKPYQCMICGRAFAQKNNAKRHIDRHKVFPHLAAQQSIRSSNKKASILVEQVDGSQASVVRRLDGCKETDDSIRLVYRCPYCNDLFNCFRCVKRHAPIHEDKKVFQCRVRTCRQLYPKLEEFLAHLATHGDRLAYDCPICGKRYDSLADIGLHQCTHIMMNEKRPFVKKTSCRCTECGDVFKSLESLERHYAQSTHEYRCFRCNRVYRSSRRLRKHLRSHGAESKFPCTKCAKVYPRAWTLKIHVKTAHESSEPGFACAQCSKIFKRRDVLRRHTTSVHCADAEFKCTFDGCSKSFKRQDRMKAHALTHDGDSKKHRCEICDKAFLRPQALKQHVRSVHEKAFRFECGRCRKRFDRPDKFEIHKKRCSEADLNDD